MASRDDLVVCRSPFYHGRLLVQQGEVWLAGDSVVTGNQRAFGPLVIRSSVVPKAVRLRRTIARSASA